MDCTGGRPGSGGVVVVNGLTVCLSVVVVCCPHVPILAPHSTP